MGTVPFEYAREKERAVQPAAPAENAPKVAAIAQALCAPQLLRHCHTSSGLDGQPLPALLATTLQHQTTATGTHAHEEPMGPLPLPVVGLKGPLHDRRSPPAFIPDPSWAAG